MKGFEQTLEYFLKWNFFEGNGFQILRTEKKVSFIYRFWILSNLGSFENLNWYKSVQY